MTQQPAPQGREKSVAQTLSESGELIDCLFLVKSGVPFDVAFSLDPEMRLAFCVIFGVLGGRVFNWDRMDWEPPKR